MKCAVYCRETGACCNSGDVGLVCAWTDGLLAIIGENPEIPMEEAVKRCGKVHYDANNMEKVLAPFIGHPEAFFSFLRDQWGWTVTVDPDGKRIMADENKAECVCPLVRTGAAHTPNLCKCSEGFAERMFSTVLKRPVKARVAESILRGGNHCVYEITIVDMDC